MIDVCKKTVLSVVRGLRGDRKGVTALEYALIAALIAVAIIGGVRVLGNNINNTFNNVATNIGSA